MGHTRLFQGLIGIDAFLIALFVLSYALVNRGVLAAIPDSLQLAREHSIPESLSYAKWVSSALVLAWCGLKTRQSHFGALALLFTMIATDDSLLIHETYGWVVAEKLQIPIAFAMDPKEIGEIIVFGLMGGAAFLLLAFAYMRADQPGKILTVAILMTILGLGITGVLFDAFHHMSATVEPPRLRRLLGLAFTIIEDGGEVIFSSVIFALSVMKMRDL